MEADQKPGRKNAEEARDSTPCKAHGQSWHLLLRLLLPLPRVLQVLHCPGNKILGIEATARVQRIVHNQRDVLLGDVRNDAQPVVPGNVDWDNNGFAVEDVVAQFLMPPATSPRSLRAQLGRKAPQALQYMCSHLIALLNEYTLGAPFMGRCIKISQKNEDHK